MAERDRFKIFIEILHSWFVVALSFEGSAENVPARVRIHVAAGS
jgi:hypothetical protein